MNNIAMYLPSSIYGGTEILMMRLADFLAKNNFAVTIYIKEDSSILQHYQPSKNINFSFEMESIENTTLIISSKYIREISYIIKNNSSVSIFIWQLQPIELISQFFPARRFDKKIPIYDKIVDILYLKRRQKLSSLLLEYHKSESLFFMDSENYNKTNDYIKLNLDHPCFIPVAIPFKVSPPQKKTLSHTFNYCVVSRISFDFKLYSIIHFITSLDEYALKNNQEIIVHIVGSGDALEVLKDYSVKLSIKCIFYGFMPPERVSDEIFPLIDIFFGMGTSLIDSSMHKIPSIITNISDENTNHHHIKYSLLYETEGYSLGSYSNNGKHSFDVLIKLIESDPEYYGEQCYSYAKKNHNSSVIFEKIKSFLDKKTGENASNIINYSQSRSFLDIIFKCFLILYKLLPNRRKEKN
ncbi:hypothetical protein [Morganella morganii]|uniref:hypothetical protein n=1 Tax=Morganella morganii TaxID=582 RepID=UPI0032DAFDD8